MWTATSVWTCRLRRTRWSPPWETATAAALSSGCSVTWPWASDPSPHLTSPTTTTTHPNQSWLSTPSPGGSYHTHHNTPLPVTAWPANTEIQAAAACLPLWRRLLLQLATGFELHLPSRRQDELWLWGPRHVQAGRTMCEVCAWRTLKSKHSCCVTQLLAVRPLCCSDCCLAAGQTIKQIIYKNIARHVSAMVCTVNDLPPAVYMQCIDVHCWYNLKTRLLLSWLLLILFPYHVWVTFKYKGSDVGNRARPILDLWSWYQY